MEECFSEYDADADYDVGPGLLYCLYWVILKIIKLQQQHANIAGKYISLQISLPGSTLAGWLADLWDIFQFKAMGIFKF